jgi:hypothetical protein
MNEYFLIALSFGTGITAAAIAFVIGNWADWRHPRRQPVSARAHRQQ